MQIASPIPLKVKMRISASTLVPTARDRTPARTNIAVFILDLGLRNVEDSLNRVPEAIM
jgi:hypothetical protein